MNDVFGMLHLAILTILIAVVAFFLGQYSRRDEDNHSGTQKTRAVLVKKGQDGRDDSDSDDQDRLRGSKSSSDLYVSLKRNRKGELKTPDCYHTKFQIHADGTASVLCGSKQSKEYAIISLCGNCERPTAAVRRGSALKGRTLG